MIIEKEDILELDVDINKLREVVIGLETAREAEIQTIHDNYDTQLIPLQEQLATDEVTRRQKLLALK